jgi:hypothetical protein
VSVNPINNRFFRNKLFPNFGVFSGTQKLGNILLEQDRQAILAKAA